MYRKVQLYLFHFRYLKELSKSVFRHKFHKIFFFFLGGGGLVVNQIAGGVRVLVVEATKCSRVVCSLYKCIYDI